MQEYLIHVFYSDKDKCYVANIPDLKFCSALGATPEQAVREVVLAKKAWLETAEKEGKPIPKPRRRPVGTSSSPRSKKP